MSSSERTWEQLLEAMCGLGEASLKMRKPGAWYVHQPNVEIKAVTRDNRPIGGEDFDGATPEEAVTKRWGLLTGSPLEYKRGRLLRRVMWNGFMWADIDIDSAESTAPTT